MTDTPQELDPMLRAIIGKMTAELELAALRLAERRRMTEPPPAREVSPDCNVVAVEKDRLHRLFFMCARDALRRGWDAGLGDALWSGYAAEATQLADVYTRAAGTPP